MENKKIAVLKTGGKQYLVKEGDVIDIEKIKGKEGETFFFDEVLLFSDGQKTFFGKPYLKEIKIKGEILEQKKGKKIIILKFKRKTRYKVKKGHRQPYTRVKIVEILKS